MTREQAEEEIQQFQKVFSVVRIIGPEQLQLLAEGKAKELDVGACKCYDFWEKNKTCNHCISIDTFKTKKDYAKIEFCNDNCF